MQITKHSRNDQKPSHIFANIGFWTTWTRKVENEFTTNVQLENTIVQRNMCSHETITCQNIWTKYGKPNSKRRRHHHNNNNNKHMTHWNTYIVQTVRLQNSENRRLSLSAREVYDTRESRYWRAKEKTSLLSDSRVRPQPRHAKREKQTMDGPVPSDALDLDRYSNATGDDFDGFAITTILHTYKHTYNEKNKQVLTTCIRILAVSLREK